VNILGSTFHEIIQAVEIHEGELAGQAVAIDGTSWLHQFLKVTMTNAKGTKGRLVIIDKTCQLINHLRGFMYRTHYLLTKRIWPVFVFDGAETRKTRNAVSKAQLHDKYRAASKMHSQAVQSGAIPLAKAIGQRMDFAYPVAEKESKMLLEFLGMPVITAPGEGEAQCAWLERQGLVDAVVTKDADALLYGAATVIENLAVKQRMTFQYRLKPILALLGITREQLVDLAILVGTDFNPGVPSIGPRTALKLVRSLGRIEDIITKYPDKDWSSLDVDSARHPFSPMIETLRERFLQPVVDERPDAIEWHAPDITGLNQFLLNQHSLSPDLVGKVIMTIQQAERR